jgi:putative membrane protein
MGQIRHHCNGTGICCSKVWFVFFTLLTASGVDKNHAQQSSDFSHVFGITLVIIAVVITLGAQYNHHIYVRTLPPQDVPALAISWLGSLLSLSIALVGVLLAIYLILA